jgi:hypothetical protein
MPFLTDIDACIEMVAPNEDAIWFYSLSINSEQDRNWQYLKKVLNSHYPELTEKYRRIAFSGNHPYWDELRIRLGEIQAKSGFNMEIHL